MPTTHIKQGKQPQFNKITTLEVFNTVPGGKIWFQGVKIAILRYKTQFL